LKDRKEDYIQKLQGECSLQIERLKLAKLDEEERRSLIVAAIDGKNEKIAQLERFAKEGVPNCFM
jgi:hypothetical protein